VERRDAGAHNMLRSREGRVVLVLLGRTPDLSVRQLKGPPVDRLGGGNWSGKRFTDAAQLIKKSVLASTWHLSHTLPSTTSIYKAAPGPNCALLIRPIIFRASTHSCRWILPAHSRLAFDGHYIKFLEGRDDARSGAVMQKMGQL